MLYSYKCHKCHTEQDRLVKVDDADKQICDCGEPLEQIHTFSTTFHLKGKWFKTTKGY